MKAGLGLALGACCAIAIGCAAQANRAAPAPSAAQAMPDATDRHAEIDRLDKAIDEELAKRGLPAAEPPMCSGQSCAGTAAQPMSVSATAVQDPACKPAPTDTCKDSCTLSDSICSNAGRICEIAQQLGGNDAYANEKCAKGKTSCETSRSRCCTCQL